MRFLIQRTRSAAVHIDGIALAESHGLGMLILIGISPDDTAEDIEYLVKKATQLRIFDDEDGVMNRSILDVGGDIIAVSQFTLMAETKKGNRPTYVPPAPRSPSPSTARSFAPLRSDSVAPSARVASAPICRYL